MVAPVFVPDTVAMEGLLEVHVTSVLLGFVRLMDNVPPIFTMPDADGSENVGSVHGVHDVEYP
jgi:hypothetical protein